MKINFFVLKGELNGKIVVVRFFFFVGYSLHAVHIKDFSSCGVISVT